LSKEGGGGSYTDLFNNHSNFASSLFVVCPMIIINQGLWNNPPPHPYRMLQVLNVTVPILIHSKFSIRFHFVLDDVDLAVRTVRYYCLLLLVAVLLCCYCSCSCY